MQLCSHWLSYCFLEEGWNALGLSGRSFVFLTWLQYTMVQVLNDGLALSDCVSLLIILL